MSCKLLLKGIARTTGNNWQPDTNRKKALKKYTHNTTEIIQDICKHSSSQNTTESFIQYIFLIAYYVRGIVISAEDIPSKNSNMQQPTSTECLSQASAKCVTNISFSSGNNHIMCKINISTAVLDLRKLWLERFINFPKIMQLLSEECWDLNLCRIPLKYQYLYSTVSGTTELVLRGLTAYYQTKK